MNTFPIEVYDPQIETINYDVAKADGVESGPIYIVGPHDGFGPAFRLTKTELGWKQVPPLKQVFPQSFIDKTGVEIEKKEPEDFDPEYDEEAELGMMGLDDEETSEGFNWVGDE